MNRRGALLEMAKIERSYYNSDSRTVAKSLLGTVLVHETAEGRMAARIVETEAYGGVTDQAAHSFGGRRTPRVEVMYGEAGFAYLFMIYGIHFCFNIVTNRREVPEAVLIRAVEPLCGIEQMATLRYGKPFETLTRRERRHLTNGPGKLCQALGLNRQFNGVDLCGDTLYLEESDGSVFPIVSTTRVGVDYAGPAKDYCWRFYIRENAYVSVV